MAKDSSFDVVSEFDKQELVNAVDQVKRDISSRFDLKDSNSDVVLDGDKTITITTCDDMKLRKGLTQELAKAIVADIKASKLKVQASIQGEQVRVSGKDKDELQEVIKMLRGNENKYDYPLQFGNYR